MAKKLTKENLELINKTRKLRDKFKFRNDQGLSSFRPTIRSFAQGQKSRSRSGL